MSTSSRREWFRLSSLWKNGAMIEVGMIGNEGFVGVPVLLGADTSPLEAMVQIPGSALRMQASVFREEAGRSTALSRLLLRYVQALHIQVSLSAAWCYRTVRNEYERLLA